MNRRVIIVLSTTMSRLDSNTVIDGGKSVGVVSVVGGAPDPEPLPIMSSPEPTARKL